MDQELKRYRTRLQRKWDRRTTRRDSDGRRKEDYKSPSFFTVGFIVQLLTLIIGGLVLLVVMGCRSIKKSLLGG